MGNADGWLTAAAFHESAHRDASASTGAPTLSREHLKDLVTLAGSAVLSTVFFLAPLVLPEQPSPLAGRALIVESALAPALAPAFTFSATPTVTPVRARPALPPSPLLARAFSSPALIAIAAPGPAPASSAYASVRTRSGRSREEGLRTPDLARLVIGDGRYRVQPFPSPSGQN